MKLVHSCSIAFAICAIGAPAWAADEDQHQAHHPAETAVAPATKAVPGPARVDPARMDAQMKAMREMHDRMLAAKSPAEREALRADQMKVMQDSMTMMNGMSSGGMGGMGAMKGDQAARNQTMEARMEMMQATMQMMMDRLPDAAVK